MSFTHLHTVTTEWFLNGTTPTLTVPATTAGSILVMFVSEPNNSGVSNPFAFPAGWTNTYVTPNANNRPISAVGYLVGASAGITGVQVTGVNNTADTHVCYMEFASTGNDGAFDSLQLNNGLAGVGSITTTLSSGTELVIEFLSLRTFNETGSPTYDTGFTGVVIAHDSSSGGSTYAEYKTNASSGTTNVQPSGAFSNDWNGVAIAFNEPGPTGSLHTTLTPTTTLSEGETVHSGSLQERIAPNTQLSSGHSYNRAMASSPVTRTRYEAGGYSPRTVPQSALIGSRQRVVLQAANLDVTRLERTVPQSVLLTTRTFTRTVPQGVCFVLLPVPQTVVLKRGNISRTVTQHAFLWPTIRVIGQHVVLTPVLVLERSVGQRVLFGIFVNSVPMSAVFTTLTRSTRRIPMQGAFATQEANVQRTIPQHAGFGILYLNNNRTVPTTLLGRATSIRTVLENANLVSARVVPMTIQSPHIVLRVVPMSAGLGRTKTRTVLQLARLGVVGAQRIIGQHSTFNTSSTRTVGEHALLAVIIPHTRTIPNTTLLKATDMRLIPERALLGGNTLSWILDKPVTSVIVSSGLTAV